MKGSCLCGSVRFEVDMLSAPIMHCHCHSCRKAHAAAFATTADARREHFRWLKGRDKLSSYASSPGKLRHFCSLCGSHLVAERPAQPHLIVRMAVLDDDPGKDPAAHFWTSQDAAWLKFRDMPSYPEWQDGR